MVNYFDIVEAIPEATYTSAMAELAVAHPAWLRTWTDGVASSTAILDDEGVQVEVDGKFLNDATIVTAFNQIYTLNAPTTSKGRHRQTYLSLSADIGVALTAQLESAVDAAIVAGDLSQWVNTALNSSGIDVNDPQVAAVLTSLIGQHGFDANLVTSILNTGNEQLLKFPNLKLGHVQTALQKRHRGEI